MRWNARHAHRNYPRRVIIFSLGQHCQQRNWWPTPMGLLVGAGLDTWIMPLSGNFFAYGRGPGVASIPVNINRCFFGFGRNGVKFEKRSIAFCWRLSKSSWEACSKQLTALNKLVYFLSKAGSNESSTADCAYCLPQRLSIKLIIASAPDGNEECSFWRTDLRSSIVIFKAASYQKQARKRLLIIPWF